MSGILSGESVIVKDKNANRLYNKGYFGTPLPGGELKLNLIEALYLLDKERLKLNFQENLWLSGKKNKKSQHQESFKPESSGKEINYEDLFLYSYQYLKDFEIKYLVFRDLRSRGFIARLSDGLFDFELYKRGENPSKGEPFWNVLAISERDKFSIEKLTKLLKKRPLRIIAAIVDEESDITYYEIEREKPEGNIAFNKLPKKVEGILLKDRVIILNKEDSLSLFDEGGAFFGKLVGKHLQLSLVEAYFLMKEKILKLKDSNKKRINLKTFKERALRIEADFMIRFKVYRQLKERNLIPKTGFKYGTHFRVYENAPTISHADWLFHVLTPDSKASWAEISRGIRLAHGVKKKLIFVFGKEYIQMRWMRL